ncbi:hypothetical protein Droror1_Dr00019002 [Drosera rotundifolia]
MTKKPKSPENQSPPNNAANPNPKPSSIFDQLKLQPLSPKQALESHSKSEPDPVSHTQMSKDADLSKRKRNKEKRDGFDGGSEEGFTGEVLKGKIVVFRGTLL